MANSATRRQFLKSAAAAGILLVVGFSPDGTIAAGSNGAGINPFVRILPDGRVEVVLKHFEMGQGTSTGLTTLIAEEMNADWQMVTTTFAPADDALYKNLFFNVQGTGGSTAIANSFMQYRQAGAAAREMLVAAASKAWGVPSAAITVENSTLRSGDKTAHFGELAGKAAVLDAPANPKLKTSEEFDLIGRDGLARQDSIAKTNGTAEFAMDVRVPGMVYAVVLRSPRFGGRLSSFDAGGAADLPGFVDARALPAGTGVAVFAKSTWAAIQAREAVNAEWDYAEAENRSTNELIAYHRELLDKDPQFPANPTADFKTTASLLAQSDKLIEVEYQFPFLAHAPMEPLNCVIEPTDKGVLLHDGCQSPGSVKPTIAHTLGMEPENVEIRTVFAGGSFGRRANPSSDYAVEAAMIFATFGGKTPVKVVWTREDDIRGGHYRPMALHRARIGIADDAIAAWEHRVAVKPIIKGTFLASALMSDPAGVDPLSVEGLADTHYAIPNLSVGLSDSQTRVPVLWWRSVGHTHTAYVMETLIDTAAHSLGKDPYALRLELLADDNTDNRRLTGVLQLAAEKAAWGQAPAGTFQGIAVHKSFSTYVAEVVDISLRGSAVKVDKVTCAVDCGVAVNPDIVRAQMEGGIGFGLGAIMRNQITLTNGEVDQSNFTDYETIRIADMPAVDVHIVKSDEAPTGVGEPAVPVVGPALANAIFAATGKRITKLPMSENDVEFA
jgi:isoquinoline 1-oxidoreductase beta subunit